MTQSRLNTTEKAALSARGVDDYTLDREQAIVVLTAPLVSDGGAGTIVLATFRATGSGTGYSANDIILLRQTAPAAPEYYNATTDAVITPNPADLGPVGSGSNVSVTGALPAGTNIIGKTYITDGTDDATVRNVTGAKALDVSIVDGSGNQITSFGGGTQYADGAAQATPTGTVALGFDGSNVQAISTDASGNLQVDVLSSAAIPVTDNGGSLTVDGTVGISGTVTVDGSGVTQPVSAASLPLPTGAATSANQTTGNTSLSTIATNTTGLNTLDKNAGAVSTNTLRTISASDDLVVSQIGATNASAATSDTGTFALIPLVKRLLSVKLPLVLGSTTAANSFPVTLSTDGIAAQIAAGSRGTLTAHNTSAANAAATFTIAAPGAGNFTQLITVFFGYNAPPANGTLTIAATGLTSIVLPVVSSGPGFLPIPLRIPVNTAVTATLSAGGSGVIGYVSAIHQPVTV